CAPHDRRHRHCHRNRHRLLGAVHPSGVYRFQRPSCPFPFRVWSCVLYVLFASAGVGSSVARLFISYKREEQDYAFAVRQWLIDAQGWLPEDIFVDRDRVRAGADWRAKILSEAEAAQAVLFLASDASLNPGSFCYLELSHARGTIIAVTIKGIKPD